MSGHIYRNDFLDRNAAGSKRGKKGKKGKNSGLFAFFCPFCLFCFQTISSTAKPIFEMCPDLSSQTQNNVIIQAAGASAPLDGEISLPAAPPGIYRLELAVEDLLRKGAERIVSAMVKISE